mgnify:CR=1 FL=1
MTTSDPRIRKDESRSVRRQTHRNATQRNATQHNATQHNATQRNTTHLTSSSPPPLLQFDVAKYFVCQIELMASMCHGRSYNCIAQLQDYYPYHLIVGIVSDSSHPETLRFAFCKLLLSLWIDRYPHSPNCGRPQLPDLAWVNYSLNKKSASEVGALPVFDLGSGHPLLHSNETFLSMKDHTKFYLVR